MTRPVVILVVCLWSTWVGGCALFEPGFGERVDGMIEYVTKEPMGASFFDRRYYPLEDPVTPVKHWLEQGGEPEAEEN